MYEILCRQFPGEISLRLQIKEHRSIFYEYISSKEIHHLPVKGKPTRSCYPVICSGKIYRFVKTYSRHLFKLNHKMRSTLLLIACVTLLILVIRRYITIQENKKSVQSKTVHHHIIKDAYSLLPEDLKIGQLHNY